ncbi:hypothetical protein QY008_25070, partial [Klebsiella pneumoniae]|nr:hypothetical protein [Klebsiella pneumoniae]
FMGDRLEYVNGRNYQRIDNGLGISFQLDYGFRVDYELLWSSFFGHADQMVGLCTGGQLGGRAGQRFVLCG